jgi:hypothetical protein
MSIVQNFIPEIEEFLTTIDNLKDEHPSFQMAAIYIDQALHVLKDGMAELDRIH